MTYTAAVITVSDSTSMGQRTDTSGPAICSMLEEAGYSGIHTAIVPDDIPAIRAMLTVCADEKQLDLIITTGSAGLSPPGRHPRSDPRHPRTGDQSHSRCHVDGGAEAHSPRHAFLRRGGHPRAQSYPQSARQRKSRPGKSLCRHRHAGARPADDGRRRSLNRPQKTAAAEE